MLLLKKIGQTFIFGNVFVALCAYFLSVEELYFTCNLQLINPTSLFIFFATLLIYNYRKFLFAGKELTPLLTNRGNWVIQHKKLLGVICACAVLGILISISSFNKKTILFLLPLFFVSFFYATPFSRNYNSSKRLRHLPFLKIFLVAGVWSAVTVLFPVLENDNSNLFSYDVAFTFCCRFIFLFAITLPFDIRDIELDKKNGVKTFPVSLGEQKSIYLSIASLSLFIFFYLFSLFWANPIQKAMAWGYVLSGIISIGFVAQAKTTKGEYYVAFWIEGLMLIQFLLLLLTNYLFNKGIIERLAISIFH